MQAREFEGKVVLVTGAGINIGRSVALTFAKAGATVAVNTRSSREAAENTVLLVHRRIRRDRASLAALERRHGPVPVHGEPGGVHAVCRGIISCHRCPHLYR